MNWIEILNYVVDPSENENIMQLCSKEDGHTLYNKITSHQILQKYYAFMMQVRTEEP